MRNILGEVYNQRKIFNNKYNKKGITNKIYSKIKDKKIKKYSIDLMKYYRNNISYKSMRELAIAYNELKNIECNKYNNITKFDNIYNRYLNLSSLKLIMGDKYFVINLSIKNKNIDIMGVKELTYSFIIYDNNIININKTTKVINSIENKENIIRQETNTNNIDKNTYESYILNIFYFDIIEDYIINFLKY